MLPTGARAVGMGNTAATVSDPWSIFSNPAGISTLEGMGVVVTYENKFQIEGLNASGAGGYANLPVGSAGLSVSRFGDDLFNEQIGSFSYGNKLGLTSLGVRINYIQYHIADIGTHGVFSIDFGGIAEITKELYFGAYVRNLNQAQLAALYEEKLPTFLTAGLSYRPDARIMVNIETEKDIDYPASFKCGLNYEFFKKLSLRTGVSTYPFKNYFGLGLRTSRLSIDYAITRSPTLAYSHQASVFYQLKRSR